MRYWRATGCTLALSGPGQVTASHRAHHNSWTIQVPEDKLSLTPCQFTGYLIQQTLQARGLRL